MHERIKFCSILLVLIVHSDFLVGQTYVENFEDSAIGDTVLSVGIVGEFGAYLVDANGVNGSKGFEVPVAFQFPTFQSGILPVQFGVDNIGEQLTFRVDAQVTLTGGQVTIPAQGLFDLNLFGVSDGDVDFLIGQFAVDDEDNTFTTRIFTSGPNVDNVNLIDDNVVPLDEIGIADGLIGDSTFFGLQVEILKLNNFDFVVSTSVFDLDGNLLSRQTSDNINIEAIFENFVFAQITTTEIGFFESVRFDNVSYVVSSIVLGDVNRDEEVNLLDVAPFVDLTASGTYQGEADVNQDGQVNLLDVGPFVALLSGG